MAKVCLINLILIFFILVNGSAYAEQRQLYNTASYLARGKAMVATADDYNVLFVNPAGIPLIKEPILNFEFMVEGSNGMSQNLTAFFGHTSDKYWRLSDQKELAAMNGKNTRARLGFLATYIDDLISFAFISNNMLDSAVNTTTQPMDTIFSSSDIALQFGLAKGFFDKKQFRLGGTGKVIYRGSMAGTFSFSQLQTTSVRPVGNADANDGLAFSLDLGSQYTWNVGESEFSLGLAALDLCSPFGIQPTPKGLFGDGNLDRPEILPARIDFGLGYKVPNIFKGITLITNLDIIKAVTKSESSFKDMLHFGVEFKFPQFLSLRAGINQLYWTAGIGIKYWILDASFATYVENTTIYNAIRTPSDRRYAFQFGFYF